MDDGVVIFANETPDILAHWMEDFNRLHAEKRVQGEAVACKSLAEIEKKSMNCKAHSGRY